MKKISLCTSRLLTLGTKSISTIFAQFETNEHAFRIGLYLPLDIVVWYIMSQEVEIHKAIKLKDFIDWHNKKEMTVLF